MNVYKTTRWLKKRAKVIRRDGYLCQESKRYGKSVQADTVHHIYPVELYPELAFVDWNLMSLSNRKHNAMHIRDSHEMTDKGLYWQERVRPQFERWMSEHGRDTAKD